MPSPFTSSNSTDANAGADARHDPSKKFGDLGLDVIGDSPAEFTAAIEREIPQWARVIKQAGIKAE